MKSRPKTNIENQPRPAQAVEDPFATAIPDAPSSPLGHAPGPDTQPASAQRDVSTFQPDPSSPREALSHEPIAPLKPPVESPQSLNRALGHGTMLGGYRLLRLLGQGGMGSVYEAEPAGGGEQVALKVLKERSPHALASLKSEFRSVNDLTHPNIARLGDLNATVDPPFFTMELIQGVTLDRYVHSGFETSAAAPEVTYHETRLREAFSQLASGLQAMHQANLVHRDIKPSNVMVNYQGRVAILDMGLVAAIDPCHVQGKQHPTAGTLYFMPPEQVSGHAVDPAWDWYAVGVMLFECLTGEKAFHGTPADWMNQKLQINRPRPRQLVALVPQDLDTLCYQLLDPDPMKRPEASEIFQALGSQQHPEIYAPTWIGRETELEQLQQAWQQVEQGQPSVVFVGGLSGLGKTSLVDRFLAQLRRSQPIVVLRGRCYENEAVAYRGFDSVIDGLAEYLRGQSRSDVEKVMPLDIDKLCQLFPVLTQVPAIASYCFSHPTQAIEPRERRLKGIGALRELLSRLVNFKAKLVMFLDDLQQGDEETAAIFRELFRADQAPPILFIGTYRREDLETSVCLRQIRAQQLDSLDRAMLVNQIEIAIDRLPDVEATRLASSLLNRYGVVNADIKAIVHEADGDPLFIQMLVEHRAHEQVHSECATTDKSKTTLRQVIKNRIAILPAEEHRLIELLSIAGKPLAERDLFAVVGYQASLGLISTLRIKRLVRRTGNHQLIELYHDKIRETVRELVPSDRSQSYCLSLAEQIDQRGEDSQVEFVADLYRRGGDLQLAGARYQRAACYLDSLYSFQRAAECYELAIDLLQPQAAQAIDLRTRLGNALANAARSAESAKQYLLAAESAEGTERARLQQQAALRYLTSGHVESGTKVLRQSLDYHGIAWPKTRAAAIVGLIWRLIRVKQSRLRLRSSAKTSQLQQDQSDACWAAAAGLTMVDPLRGFFYITECLLRSLRAGPRETVMRDLAAYIGQAAIGGSRSRKVTYRILKTFRALEQARFDPYTRAMQQLSRGIAALLRGNWASSLRCCDRASHYLSHTQCQGKTWELSTARTFALWALQYQGNLKELAQRQPDLLRMAKENDDLYATLNYGTQVMAHLQLANDQPVEGLRLLDEDQKRLSNEGFFIQHHNYVLAKTYLLIYLQQPSAALESISGQWNLYKQQFLSQIQQVRIDHHQVLARALLAAMAADLSSETATSHSNLRTNFVAEAQLVIALLRRETAPWASALATGFEASLNFQRQDYVTSMQLLRTSVTEFNNVDMRLFSLAARHHLARWEGIGYEAVQSEWAASGIVHSERFADTMLPGFNGKTGNR